MKECKKCKTIKDESEFYRQTKRSGNKRLCSWCKKCSSLSASEGRKKLRLENPELVREQERKWHHSNKDKYNQKTKERSRALKQKCVEYKGGCCINCGFNKYLSALDFHHIDRSEKDFMITQTTNWDKIRIELDKCILLCSNCHRALHSGDLKINNSNKLNLL